MIQQLCEVSRITNHILQMSNLRKNLSDFHNKLSDKAVYERKWSDSRACVLITVLKDDRGKDNLSG